ncbi:MAG: hypothetical protein LBN38_02655 [Verrucomicrobiota bacterium]|jgi:hypothetical protein|nr:hypothetical protein [Verrucomicrobiota bacterium]
MRKLRYVWIPLVIALVWLGGTQACRRHAPEAWTVAQASDALQRMYNFIFHYQMMRGEEIPATLEDVPGWSVYVESMEEANIRELMKMIRYYGVTTVKDGAPLAEIELPGTKVVVVYGGITYSLKTSAPMTPIR